VTIKRDLKKLIHTEKKIISMIKKDAEIIEKKIIEKDISKLLDLIDKQELLDEQELQQIEFALKKEEQILSKERERLTIEKKKIKKNIEEKEILDETHHLRIIYVLMPLIRQKNESLKKQKDLLTERRGEHTINDLPMLIKKEKDAIAKILPYEDEAEKLLNKIVEEELAASVPSY